MQVTLSRGRRPSDAVGMSESLPDAARKALGRRWWLGILALFLALLAAFAVLCLHFPAWLTTPALREVYPMALVRALIAGGIVAAALIGALAVALGRGRRLGALGLALAFTAQLAGGAWVEVATPVAKSRHLGLDWLALDLLLLAAVFVPLERAFARLPAQPVFRRGWRTDLAYFFVSHLLVQLLALATVTPALLLFRWAADSGLQQAVAAQPLALQLVEAVLAADLASYAAHRAFHAVPWLWRFHAIHHSSEQLDWLAGSRLHLVDVIATRAVAFLPLFVLGFSEAALAAYLVWVSAQATWIHANLRGRTGWLDHVLVTPRFHHWHHAAHAEAADKNFAVHFPWIDRLFGTHHLPAGAWPARYGVLADAPPAGFLAQLWWPFSRRAG
jgi:sterol desaturase/sphingolipid hydroxylase (fatty acid hydroxylase superfamily)